MLPIGSVAEDYVRYAQTLGQAPTGGWLIRPLAPPLLTNAAVGRLVSGMMTPAAQRGALQWQVLEPSAHAWYNSTFPFGWNDGAVWRGRGATTAVEGGIAVKWHAISAAIDPLAFVAQNQAFDLLPNAAGANTFTDPIAPNNIDRPQRFGDRAYYRLDPGQSYVRVDGLGLSAGFSTANQWIGPMSEWPIVLSNNAPGFPNVFLGSSHPWNVWIGHVHGRVFYGSLAQSDYFAVPDTAARRFTTGIAGTLNLRFIPGLELGLVRMFANSWPTDGIGWPEIRKPFEAFLKENVHGDPGASTNSSVDNQLASGFARWVFPGSGFEVYGEYARDDHSWNLRDAIEQPDHTRMYGLGLRKAWALEDGTIHGFRAEVVNLDPPTVARARGQGGRYTHTGTRQGHTERGQVIGAGFAAIDGNGSLIGMTRIRPGGERFDVSLTRMVVREQLQSPNTDVEYALAFERSRRMRGVMVEYGVTAVDELNRYFRADVGNVMLSLGISRAGSANRPR